jgi:6-pyruvoyltetrahydropterin/6-carboxytetrahydropterin synthase
MSRGSSHRIEVARERYKFSCAHMTIFPDGTKERLHGHNYFVSLALDLVDVSFDQMIDFAVIKRALGQLCEEWKEYTLIAENNPFHETVRADDDEVEIRVCGKRYVFPASDVKLLPIDNVSVEALSAHICDLLLERLGGALSASVVSGFEVTISENPGQGATCHRRLG